MNSIGTGSKEAGILIMAAFCADYTFTVIVTASRLKALNVTVGGSWEMFYCFML